MQAGCDDQELSGDYVLKGQCRRFMCHCSLGNAKAVHVGWRAQTLRKNRKKN